MAGPGVVRATPRHVRRQFALVGGAAGAQAAMVLILGLLGAGMLAFPGWHSDRRDRLHPGHALRLGGPAAAEQAPNRHHGAAVAPRTLDPVTAIAVPAPRHAAPGGSRTVAPMNVRRHHVRPGWRARRPRTSEPRVSPSSPPSAPAASAVVPASAVRAPATRHAATVNHAVPMRGYRAGHRGRDHRPGHVGRPPASPSARHRAGGAHRGVPQHRRPVLPRAAPRAPASRHGHRSVPYRTTPSPARRRSGNHAARQRAVPSTPLANPAEPGDRSTDGNDRGATSSRTPSRAAPSPPAHPAPSGVTDGRHHG